MFFFGNGSAPLTRQRRTETTLLYCIRAFGIFVLYTLQVHISTPCIPDYSPALGLGCTAVCYVRQIVSVKYAYAFFGMMRVGRWVWRDRDAELWLALKRVGLGWVGLGWVGWVGLVQKGRGGEGVLR